jgi:hypothetical protein
MGDLQPEPRTPQTRYSTSTVTHVTYLTTLELYI